MPRDHTGSLFNRFLSGYDADPHAIQHQPLAQRLVKSQPLMETEQRNTNNVQRRTEAPTKSYIRRPSEPFQPWFWFGYVNSSLLLSPWSLKQNQWLKITTYNENQHQRCKRDHNDSICACAWPNWDNSLLFCIDTGPPDHPQMLHTDPCSTGVVPFQDNLSKHVSCGGRSLFDVVLPTSNRPHTYMIFITVGSR